MYVGLPALDAEAYATGGNWLGVALASLMKVARDRQAWLRAESLRRILIDSGLSDYRKLLLSRCVEAYGPLEGEQGEAFRRMLEKEHYGEVKDVEAITYEEMLCVGVRNMLVRMGRAKFGRQPSKKQQEQLDAITDLARMEALGERLLTVGSWSELLAGA